jgi:hypothetical protein
VVLVNVTGDGMKFMVEKDKSMKAKAYLKSSCFQEYTLTDPDGEIEFTLSLSVFLHCLNVFGVASHLCMSFSAQGSALSLM